MSVGIKNRFSKKTSELRSIVVATSVVMPPKPAGFHHRTSTPPPSSMLGGEREIVMALDILEVTSVSG
jgi:hypothetical protein